ncbi:MAG: DUF1566 domain-containing protein [Hydrogenophaga sp.]|nr:DUF1566 domain-containing protein [Hydrogenophaga sp.]
MTPQLALAVFTALLPIGVAAQAEAPRFALSEDGDHVIDLKAKLAWPRCVEGMVWDGKTCTGKPQLFDHAQASAHALARWKAEGIRWRLPHTTELKRLVDARLSPPGLDPALFPAAPREWHWSGTANIRAAGQVNQYSYDNIQQGRTNDNADRMAYLHGWAVNLVSGEARGDVSKRTALPLRLVRPAF